MDVNNVKIRVYVKPEFIDIYQTALKNTDYMTKQCSSFYVLRCKFVFICYISGCVNITGIKHTSSVPFAVETLGFMLKLPHEYSMNVVVDNITARLTNPKVQLVNLSSKSYALREYKKVQRIKYNRERFPCMFLKTEYGTIIWSPYNKVSGVGIKSAEDLRGIYEIITHIQTL